VLGVQERINLSQDVQHRGRTASLNGRRESPSAPAGDASANGARTKPPPAARPTPTARRDRLYNRLLAAADLVAAATALVLDAEVLGDDRLDLVALAAIPAVLLVGKVAGLYDRDELLLRRGTLDEAPALFRVATLYTFVVWLSENFFIDGYFGQDQLLALWASLFGFMLAARAGARWLARWAAPPERCLVLGRPADAEVVRRKLHQGQGVKAEVVGRVPLDRVDHTHGNVPVLGGTLSLPVLLREHGIERVVVAPGEDSGERMLDAVELVMSCGVKVSVLPRLLEVVGSSVELDELRGATLLALRGHGLSRSSRLLKRSVDVVGAGLGLVLLAPLLAGIAAAIKLSSRGPVLFRQTRMGRNDTVFEMVKFRTMVEGADEQKAELAALNEAEGLFKITDDPRVTRVGRFLRPTSLDELPQLINVFRGEMSIVGPRPLVVDEDRHVTGWERRRLVVRPGMTGLWQIYGSSRIPLRDMVKIDYLYGANWSLWLDAKVILRTVPYILKRRGL
jgi:exopolysaccharide biosynthesis polyprenyl glycosylphosphotransferase